MRGVYTPTIGRVGPDKNLEPIWSNFLTSNSINNSLETLLKEYYSRKFLQWLKIYNSVIKNGKDIP